MPEDKNNYPDYIEKIYDLTAAPGQTAERLDVYLTNAIQYATRNKVQKAIEDGNVTINGKTAKASRKIQPNDHIICKIMKPPPIELIPEDIPLDIVFEDDYLMVINKPAGMCTHPGFGNRYGTLVNAVLYHMGMRESITVETDEEDEELNEAQIYSSDEIRPGIVHRLDKDTSGLIVIAKEPRIHSMLQLQFHDRTISRQYVALAWGIIDEDAGTIEADIGRSTRDRKLFAVVKKDGKHAVTDFNVLQRFSVATLVQLKLRTGRTHQIRVHLSHNNHPIIGDNAYGGDSIVYGGSMPHLRKIAVRCLKTANRQLLHAKILSFVHPMTNERLNFETNLPPDIQKCIEILGDSSEN